ncbi:hypothetical protein G6R40_02075 [Chryseobacterium sp. POL2]|uniref:hypothetical protein n=1 Tax=Chryseobacterium sp. POL2 TaxID=2713414 RepID=UPI0013E0F14B|nr:hypothetical protein [Chryseobacterium sp. POL2]QIG88520.1 hypothetical protein G6R40_02075 [Chryseobacterium sp. POL2]
MKKYFLIITIILTSLILFNCSEDDCFIPPENIVFEFVNVSGENLLQNGTLDKSKIIVQQNEGNGNSIGIKTNIREDNKISLEGVGWSEGSKDYDVYLTINPVKTFRFKTTSSKITGKCSGYKIDNIQIEDINSTSENGYYKIIVE